MRSVDDNPKALQDVYFLDNIGEHMERHYIDLYSHQNEKKEEQNKEVAKDFYQDFLSNVNLFSGHNPNY